MHPPGVGSQTALPPRRGEGQSRWPGGLTFVHQQLLEFLGMQWDENILSFDRHARERKTIKTPSYRQVSEPIYKTSLYRWKHYQRYFKPLLPVLQPYIDRFGYRNGS